MLEVEARENHYCICGKEKGIGKLVCWDCYVQPVGYPPLEGYPGTYEDWVKYRVKGVIDARS